METITKYKTQTNLSNNIKVLFVSTDIVALIPYDNINDDLLNRKWLLLKGEDFSNGGLLLGDEENIMTIVQNCYNARETGIPYTFQWDYKIITFQ